MAEIVIHRCTLRIVRRHGWSWGPAPERLLRAVVAALPLLLARKLGDLFADETDREITERVKLTVAVKLSELLEFTLESASLQDGAVGPPGTEAFAARLSQAVRQAFPDEMALAALDATASDISKPDSEEESIEALKTPSERVLIVLRQWQRFGELEVYLSSFSKEELAAWFASLYAAIATLAAAKRRVLAQRIFQTLQPLVQPAVATVSSQSSIAPAHFHRLLELAEQLEIDSIDDVSLQQTFNAVMSSLGVTFGERPGALEPESEFQPAAASSGLIPLTPRPARLAPERASPIKSIRTQTEFNIRSALPFLLLGPLSKIGYLDTLAATLETANLTSEATLFAAALAAKVLPPPARGWRRDPDDLAVVAAFAGVETPPPGHEIAHFARKITGHLTPLDAIVSYTLVKGHTPGSPMMLHQTHDAHNQTGFLLIELEGLFPVAWAKDLKSLLPTLRYFSETHLLVQQASARVETLRELDTAGFRFVTDAPPTRGESWREVRHPASERLYTNDHETNTATLVRIADSLSQMAEQAELLWKGLSNERPAIPTARHSALELNLTMAAALALGTISWVLWRERETTTPMLALERFGNLSARVRFTSKSVQLSLPLGRRQQDLREHGFLADLRDVPWLAGRKVEFLGG